MLGPVDGEDGGLEEFLVGILLAHILPREAGFGQFLYQELMAGQELLFGEPRVEHESLVLAKKISHMTTRWGATATRSTHGQAYNRQHTYPITAQHLPRTVHPDRCN